MPGLHRPFQGLAWILNDHIDLKGGHMEFSASRVSLHPREKPCEEAYPKGTMKGTIKLTNWCVEIKGLDDLIAFVRKYGKIVLRDNAIEIYDDYRE